MAPEADFSVNSQGDGEKWTVADFRADYRAMTRDEFLSRYPAPFLIEVARSEGSTRTGVLETDDGQNLHADVVAEFLRCRIVPMSSLVTRGRFVIGRDIDNDLQTNNRWVSKRHAELRARGDDGWEICDLGSSNGVFVDKVKIDPGAPVGLEPGREVSLGQALSYLFVTAETLYAYFLNVEPKKPDPEPEDPS